MGKLIYNLIFLVLLPFCSFPQEKQNHQIKLIREVSPDKKIQSFIEISDSAMAVLEVLKEKWGEEQDANGIIEWNNAKIDSIEAKVRVILYHGFYKKNSSNFKTFPLSKKDKSDDIRVIRLRFLQKDRDLLSFAQTTNILKNFLNDILQQVFEGATEENESD